MQLPECILAKEKLLPQAVIRDPALLAVLVRRCGGLPVTSPSIREAKEV